MSLSCVVCDRELPDAIPGEERTADDPFQNQPYGGTTFTSHGQYGSTVWDDMSSSFLELNICDPCLVKAAEKQQVIMGRKYVKTQHYYKTWKWDQDV